MISQKSNELGYIAESTTGDRGAGNDDITSSESLYFWRVCWSYLHITYAMTGYFGTWFPYNFHWPFSLISRVPGGKEISKYLSFLIPSIFATFP